jgi:peptidoglycan/LPS O-acetylase OafA/YrhL
LSELNCYFSTPWRADSLISGSFLAWCVRQPVILEHFRAHARKLYWVLAILPPLLFLISWSGFNHDGALEHAIFAIFYSALVLLVFIDNTSPITKVMRWRPLAWIGTISYGLYLFHEPISGLAHGLIRQAPPAIESIFSGMITLTALVITFAVAAASYYLFERRIIVYGHTFKYTKSAAPLPTPSAEPQLQPLPVPLDARR